MVHYFILKSASSLRNIQKRLCAAMRPLPYLVIIAMAFFISFLQVQSVEASAPIQLHGPEWLGGQGVNVCGKSTNPYCGNEYKAGGVESNWWQCVELVQRLYNQLGWRSGIFSQVSHAKDIYTSAAINGMTRQPNGNITSVRPGDLIVHGGDAPESGGSGHVAVVDSVSTSGIIHAVHQNASSARTTYILTAGTVSKAHSGTILGVVQSPKNNLTSAISGARILVQSNKSLYLKDGPLNASWVSVTNSQPFKISSSRIAVYGGDILSVKEGDSNALWVQVTGKVDDFAITNNRIGIRIGDQLHIKEGALNAPWVHSGGGQSFSFE